MKVETTVEMDLGRTVAVRLSHGDDAIDLYAAVRWCRSAPAKEGATPTYEVGIAFTEVAEVGSGSLWRSLTVYRPDSAGR